MISYRAASISRDNYYQPCPAPPSIFLQCATTLRLCLWAWSHVSSFLFEAHLVGSLLKMSTEGGDDTIVSLQDVVEEDQQLEQTANAVLGDSDDTQCTYPKVSLFQFPAT